MLVATERSDTETRIHYRYKFLGVPFTSDEWQDEELYIRIGKAIAIMRTLHYSVVVRWELSKKSKTFNFRKILRPFSPTVSLYGHENSVMIEKVLSQVQSSKMRFLQKTEEVTLLTRSASLEIRNFLKLLLLQIERSQLRYVYICIYDVYLHFDNHFRQTQTFV